METKSFKDKPQIRGSVWAIADLHLSFGVVGKEMDVFGEKWTRHHEKIEKNWRTLIKEEDLVLIAGDISWALHLEDAIKDLEWIDRLPGTKVMIKGNHDLWWKSKSKVKGVLPKSIHLIYNDAFTWHDVTIGGSRLWESKEISYTPHIEFHSFPKVHIHKKPETPEEDKHDEKIFKGELERLKLSIHSMNTAAKHKVVMVHYPPTGSLHKETEVTAILEQNNIEICLFGHLHNLHKDAPVNFTVGNVKYFCTAADYLDFIPIKLDL
jgi:predicted phosphohydrolase